MGVKIFTFFFTLKEPYIIVVPNGLESPFIFSTIRGRGWENSLFIIEPFRSFSGILSERRKIVWQMFAITHPKRVVILY